MEQSCLIDDFGPMPIMRPENVAALGDMVRQAASDRIALYPIGGQTMLNLGNCPTQKGCAADMREMARVVDFPARDMTITVEAGITMAKLRDILAEENLRLPIDVPRAEHATLGGALAANVSGSRRYGFGTLRDYVIGISAVNDAGVEFKAGGRVVKNVAGYDVCKLLVGSLGTLGIITGATLKLRPRAEEQATVILACEDCGLEALLNRLHASRTRPVCLDVVNRSAAQEVLGQANVPVPDGVWAVILGFEGNADAIEWQVQQLVRESGDSGYLEARIGCTAGPLWQALAEWSLWPKANLTFKAALLPSAVAGFCRDVAGLAEQCWLCCHAGNGIVVGHISGDLTKQQAATALAGWRLHAAARRGWVTVPRCPPSWKDTLPVWGPAPPAAWLMRVLKEKFDPRRLFNPGRFVDEI